MSETAIGLTDATVVPAEQCWQAFEARDAGADGLFVVAVRSTGIYCRPSCPARRPKRENVQFLPTPDAAERVGYRPCLRCRPREASAQAEAVRRVCRYIEQHPDELLDLQTLSSQAGMSAGHLQRVFKRALGVAPRDYVEARRLEQFKTLIKEGEPIAAATYGAGYGSSSRVYTRATAELGMTPGAYRKGGEGIVIGYTIAASPLGPLLLAATEKGLCSVRFGESETELEASLRREYPAAELRPGDLALREWVTALIRYLEGEPLSVELPIDVQATAFQRRVWKELQAIPYGVTRSYSEVARAIGRPTAVRAVASACAANRVALVIPCHRVVREGGALGGYRWGLERKQALLRQERR